MSSPVPAKSPPCLCRRLGSTLRFILSLWTHLWPFSVGRVTTRSIATQTETQTETPPDWSNLPDVCLLAIFAYLPTRDLVHLARVCRHWKSVQTRVCESKQTLTVLFGPDSEKHLLACDALFDGPETTLSRRHIAQTSVTLFDPHTFYRRHLLATFPQVSQLALSATLDSDDQVPQLASLLDGWRSSLHSLKLILHFKVGPFHPVMHSTEYARLLLTLDKMTHLKTFTLASNCQILPKGVAQFDLPFLARLDHFAIGTGDSAESLQESFEKYATANDSLQSIRLDNRAFSFGSDGKLFRHFDDNFMAKLKHLKLSVTGRVVKFRQCTRLFPRLPSLTYLDFYLEDYAYYQQIIQCLATLPQLTHLKLTLNISGFYIDSRRQAEGVVVGQLPNLKHLSIDLTVEFSEDEWLAPYHLDWCFPGLQSLTVHAFFVNFLTTSDEEDTSSPLTNAQDYAEQVYESIRPLQIPQKTVTFEFTDFFPDKRWTLAQLAIEE